MVRTIQTTQTNTNYIPPPRQVPVYPVLVEEIPVDLPRIRVENGVILEDTLEECLPTPTSLAESLAFAAGSSSSAPPAPAVQAPAPRGNDPNDSGDDDEDDEEEEEEEENINEEANGEQQDHFVGIWPITEHYTSMFETGHFPNLLYDVLHALGT
jgi:ribosomal protein L12E/L44/L45/RPP1/RPP2